MTKLKKIKWQRLAWILGACLLTIATLFSLFSGFLFTPNTPTPYKDLANRYAREYQISPALVLAVMQTESDFDKNAISSADARGLMQITPETFEWLQTKTGEKLELDALFEPEVSVRYGTLFLSILSERFENLEAIVAAYNAGINAVTGWLADSRYSDDGKTLKAIPYEETEYYVVKIKRALEYYTKNE